jgi:cytochrome c-type biogenesis protein CcmE
MSETTITSDPPAAVPTQAKGVRVKFLIGGLILLAAVVYLIFSTLSAQQEYFITLSAFTANQDKYVDKKARISGVVLGDTIEYDGHILSFVIADVPEGTGAVQNQAWENTLHAAATDPNTPRVKVVLVDQPKPDLLKNEAQAIVTGKMGDDGVFYADDLLLKCPTRYEEAAPEAQ